MFLDALLRQQPSFSFNPQENEWARALRVTRSPNARRIALRVDPARGDICLVIPRRASEKKAWAFAQSNIAWIEQQMAKLQMQKPVPFTHGTIIPILGIDREIRIVPGTSRITDITLEDDALIVRTRRADPATNIRQYLYKLMEDTILPMAKIKADSIGKTVTEISLRDTRTRWGSCGHDGRLMLCWRLIFAPISVIDYVVAHEVAHLRYMSHGPRFWELCERLSDDFSAKDWLKANGDKLLRYGPKA